MRDFRPALSPAGANPPDQSPYDDHPGFGDMNAQSIRRTVVEVNSHLPCGPPNPENAELHGCGCRCFPAPGLRSGSGRSWRGLAAFDRLGAERDETGGLVDEPGQGQTEIVGILDFHEDA